jgi:hypothetical protein
MILNQKNQSVHGILEFSAFCKFLSLKNLISQFCRSKAQGFSSFDVFQTLFFTVFQQRNFWRLSISDAIKPDFARDTAYRFLNSPYHNWRAFLFCVSRIVITFIRTLTAKEKRKVFVVDDSLYNKNRSKKLELLSKVHDHVLNRTVNGFRFLTLAFTDGCSLIPIDFALLGGKKTICPANKDIAKRSHGEKRRHEATIDAPSVLLSMLDDARSIIRKGSYIVFDSWFCTPKLIRDIVSKGLHVTGRLKNDATHFLFRRKGKDAFLNLEQLYKKLSKIPFNVRKRQQQTEEILGSLHVSLPSVKGEKPLPVKIVFVKNRNKESEESWLAFVTTDLSLSEEEVVVMYAKRWKIEEFFKVAKSLLKLEREFQGRSYDMLIAHATLVCTRYIFLELERRRSEDIRTCGELFWHCCDEVRDWKPKEALTLIFGALCKDLQVKVPEIRKTLKRFIATLPSHLQGLCSLAGCES